MLIFRDIRRSCVYHYYTQIPRSHRVVFHAFSYHSLSFFVCIYSVAHRVCPFAYSVAIHFISFYSHVADLCHLPSVVVKLNYAKCLLIVS